MAWIASHGALGEAGGSRRGCQRTPTVSMARGGVGWGAQTGGAEMPGQVVSRLHWDIFPGDLALAASDWLGIREIGVRQGHQVGERPACFGLNGFSKEAELEILLGLLCIPPGAPPSRHIWLLRRLSRKAGKSPGTAAEFLDGTEVKCIQQPLEDGLQRLWMGSKPLIPSQFTPGSADLNQKASSSSFTK